MINILESSRELTPVETYLMTLDSNITSISKLESGFSIDVAAYLIFEDVKEDSGEVVEVLSIITPNKEVFSCQSATFKRSFKDIAKIMNGQEFAVIKTSGTTKSGRPFINCSLDVSKL